MLVDLGKYKYVPKIDLIVHENGPNPGILCKFWSKFCDLRCSMGSIFTLTMTEIASGPGTGISVPGKNENGYETTLERSHRALDECIRYSKSRRSQP